MKSALVAILATGIAQLKWTWFESDHSLRDLVTFDQASQGISGCFYLLWHVHLKQAVASLGALLTIVLLATDPFTQQLIRYVTCSEIQAAQAASIPRTSFYQTKGYHSGPLSASVSVDMQSSVNAGLFSQPASVSVQCSTGNCTFVQEYGSIGYCSTCRDITHLLEFEETCFDINADDPDDRNKPVKCTNDNVAHTWTTIVPGGISITAVGGQYAPQVANMTSLISYRPDIPSGVQIIMGKNDFSEAGNNPTTAEPLEGCDDPATNNTWRCRGYGAAACGLDPCVQIYSASVEGGNFHEEVIDQTPYNISWGDDRATAYLDDAPWTYGLVDTTCVNANERQRLLKAGYIIESDQRWLPYNLTFNATLLISDADSEKFPQSLMAHKCLYLYDTVFVDSLWEEYLYYFFNGSVSGQYGQGGNLVSFTGPQALQTIYNFGNFDFARIDSTFRNISASMTNLIRQTGNLNHSAPALGAVNHYATCVNVQWGWIAFPASVVVASLIFCVLTIITTATHHSRIWKNNPLALIFHGPYITGATSHVEFPPARQLDTANTSNASPSPFTAVSQHPDADPEDSEKAIPIPATSPLPQSIKEMESTARNVMVRLDKSVGRLKVSETQVQRRSWRPLTSSKPNPIRLYYQEQEGRGRS